LNLVSDRQLTLKELLRILNLQAKQQQTFLQG